MNQFNKKWLVLTLALSLVGAASCTKKEEGSTTGATSAASSGPVEIQLGTVGDTLAFDKTLLEAKAGATIKLSLKNNGTNAAMTHNFVLVKPGTESEVANAGIQAGPDKGYIPESPNILAHTKLLKPGESDTITFTAPSSPGEYPFICTFPGHFVTMKGILKVS